MPEVTEDRATRDALIDALEAAVPEYLFDWRGLDDTAANLPGALRMQALDLVKAGGLALLRAENHELRDVLALALPVMRRYAHDYFMGCTVLRDPLSIAPIEWEEIAPEVAAIRAATALIGSNPDADGVNTEWLDLVLSHDPALKPTQGDEQ